MKWRTACIAVTLVLYLYVLYELEQKLLGGRGELKAQQKRKTVQKFTLSMTTYKAIARCIFINDYNFVLSTKMLLLVLLKVYKFSKYLMNARIELFSLLPHAPWIHGEFL